MKVVMNQLEKNSNLSALGHGVLVQAVDKNQKKEKKELRALEMVLQDLKKEIVEAKKGVVTKKDLKNLRQMEAILKKLEEEKGSLPKHVSVTNFMLDLMKAVNKDDSTMSMQQMQDSKTTMLDTELQANILNFWMDTLHRLGMDIWEHRDHTKYVAGLQGQYNADSSKEQAEVGDQQGATSAAEGQTRSDATNLQMKAQLVQSVNGILTALTNLLGRVTA
ncbi:MAG: hypothetical protein P0S96_01925 [Simkaniaceae bacterium]|nr:hypothetical protein [Candidatus Sacchlamyda saccharinae]